MGVRSLCRADPLEEETATHSNMLARRITWTEEPGGLQSMGTESDATGHARTHLGCLGLPTCVFPGITWSL